MAPQNKGQIIELQMSHRRPLNTRDRATQSTTDKALQLRANASGKLEINEVAHGKSTQGIHPTIRGERDEPRQGRGDHRQTRQKL